MTARRRAENDRVKGRGRCPKCGSRKVARIRQHIARFHSVELEVCGNCGAAWEPMPAGGDHLDGGSPFAFPEPCDNCAFRPGSHEQQDAHAWRETIAVLKRGGRFYCHKGVPLDPDGEDGFAYPRTRATGQPIVHKLRLCRGYLNMWGRLAGKEFPPEADAFAVGREVSP